MEYNKVKKVIDEMPSTFLGGILAHIVKRCKKDQQSQNIHYCKKYKRRLFHFLDHPKINKCTPCKRDTI